MTIRTLSLGFAACSLAVAVFTGCAMSHQAGSSGRIVQPLSPTIDLAGAKAVEIKDTSGTVVLRGTFANNKADLTGSGQASGLAEIEIEPDTGGTKHEIEATVRGLAPSTEFQLLVDGNHVAT